MSELSISKEPTRLQERIDAFKEYYAIREPLSRGQTLPIILFHVARAVMFLGSCLLTSTVFSNFTWDGPLKAISVIGSAFLLFFSLDFIFTKAVKSKLQKSGHLAEPKIVLDFVEGIAGDLDMSSDLKVLLAREEFDKDPEIVMETQHIQIPFDEKMVVLRKDGAGNKFYLSAKGPTLNIEVIKN